MQESLERKMKSLEDREQKSKLYVSFIG